MADLQRVYGANGQIDGFTRDRLQPLLDTAGPVWRWRLGDPVAQGLRPSSAVQFQKAAAIRDLLSAGPALNVSLASLGHGVDAVEISAGGTTYRLDARDMATHPLIWTPTGLPHAHVALLSGSKEVHRDQSDGADLVPLAPTFTSTGGLTWSAHEDLSAGARYRHIGERAADETGTVRALGSTLVEVFASYRLGGAEILLAVDNLFDIDWNEAQFATTSRLRDEPAPITELHFTPGGRPQRCIRIIV